MRVFAVLFFLLEHEHITAAIASKRNKVCMWVYLFTMNINVFI